MTYLLDTHYMLWTVADTKKLSKNIKELISDPDNTIIVSAVSFWEVSLKRSVGKLNVEGFAPEVLPKACKQMGLEIEVLSVENCSTYHQLKATYHKDPFDRMIIWQAICNNYTLISVDSNVKKYTSEGLKVFSEK